MVKTNIIDKPQAKSQSDPKGKGNVASGLSLKVTTQRLLVEHLWPECVRFDLHSRPVCSIFSGRDCGWCCVVSMVRAYHGPDTEPEPGNAGDWVTGGAEGRRIDTRGPRGKGTWPTYLPGACYICTKHNTSYNKRVDMYVFICICIASLDT